MRPTAIISWLVRVGLLVGVASSLGCSGSGQTGREILIKAGEYANGEMYYIPDRIDVTADEKISFKLYNEGGEEHSFGSTEAKIPFITTQPQETIVLNWQAPSLPGTYKIFCDLPDHEKKGMVGTLIVAER